MPVEEVTVQDIAVAVDMTPAAVYYHFASKEQILLEAMSTFRSELVERVEALMPADGDQAGIEKLVKGVLAWIGKRRAAATVFYVNSLGLNLAVEALRRDTRMELVNLLRDAVDAVRGRLKPAEAGAIAVGLVSLIETSAASMLNQDATYSGLGARRFPAEVASMANRIAAVDA